jgi:restriction system protein
MGSADNIVWGIHAGRTGDADSLFLKHGCIAVGWHAVGDLSTIQPDRDGFKQKVVETYPEKKPGAIPGNAGQLFRFVHEMKESDFVVYPSKQDRQIHLGIVSGPYKFVKSEDHQYWNQRKVDWIKTVPRTSFSQGALYEIGSALSLFQVKNYADEFLSALEAKAVLITPVEQDDSVAVVAENTEENARDFIIKTFAQELKGHPFAHFIAHLLQKMGYRTRVSPEGLDGGIDILAYKDELGFEPPIIKVQVKSGEGKIGDHEVSALYGKVGASEKEYGLFVTLGYFSQQAESL